MCVATDLTVTHEEHEARDHEDRVQVELLLYVLVPREAALEEIHPHEGEDEHPEEEDLSEEHQQVEHARPPPGHVVVAVLLTAPGPQPHKTNCYN